MLISGDELHTHTRTRTLPFACIPGLSGREQNVFSLQVQQERGRISVCAGRACFEVMFFVKVCRYQTDQRKIAVLVSILSPFCILNIGGSGGGNRRNSRRTHPNLGGRGTVMAECQGFKRRRSACRSTVTALIVAFLVKVCPQLIRN